MAKLIADNVDKSEVGAVVQNFISIDGAVKVECDPEDANADKWTVTATTP